MTTESFHDAVRSLYEYRELIGQRDLSRKPLSAADEVRLALLERVWQWRPIDPTTLAPLNSRRFARCDVTVRATLRAGGQEHEVTVTHLGGGGIIVTGAPPLRRGEPVVVTVRVPEHGRDYQFPAQMCWKEERRGPVVHVALALNGLPFGRRHDRLRAA
jgi:hypothetical protein